MRRGVGRRVAAVVLVAFAALVAVAWPAAAHPTLLTTVPAAGYTGDGPVRQIVLAFDEQVTATSSAITVTSSAGHREPTGALFREAGSHQLVLPLVAPLTSGQFRVHWQVTAADGDVVDGAFAFGVGTAAPSVAAAGDVGGVAGTAVLRWLLFTGLALSSGGLIGERLLNRERQGSDLPAVRAPLRSGAALGFLAAGGLTALVARSAGGWSALGSVRGVELTAVEAVAFGLAAALSWSAALRRFALAPLIAVVIAEGLRAHPDAYSPGWGAVLTVVHLAAAAVWVGALVQVVRAARAWRGQGGASSRALRRYARLALALFALVVSTGTLASVLVLQRPADLLGTAYGRVLTGKLLLVAVVIALAFAGRRRVSSKPPMVGAEPGRSTRLERSVLLAVLAITALLVSLPAPRPVATVLTLPPPPVGQTAAFGTLIGQISVGATASAGQLQVALTTPGGDGGSADASHEHVAVRLKTPGAPAVRAPIRGCGPGCFLAATGWRNGLNELTIDAGASGWRGGHATFTVPWPPADASAELRRVVAALRATRTLILAEAVTSDTSRTPSPLPLRVTGQAFLESEPYANGGAPIVTALPLSGDLHRLAVGYPTIGVYLTLTLDARDRPIREVEATPDHLISNAFIYPST